MDIITAFEDITCIDIEQLRTKTRKSIFVVYRQLLAYLLRQEKYTLKRIGKLLNQDHSTIVHSVKQVKLWNNPGYEKEYELFKKLQS